MNRSKHLHASPNQRHLTHTDLTLACTRLTEHLVATPVELAALLEQLSAPTKCSAKMAPQLPYTYIQCSCSDQLPADAGTPWPTEQLDEDDERTFDPRAPRSNYSLYPLEYLLYCEDCQQIRCPKCVAEETVTYFCPNCLFEVPSSNLRSEGNRYEMLGPSGDDIKLTRNAAGAHEAATNVHYASVLSK